MRILFFIKGRAVGHRSCRDVIDLGEQCAVDMGKQNGMMWL